MQFFILSLTTLALNIGFDRVFITVLSNSIDIKTFPPELTTPQLLLHLWVFFKEFFGCDTFNQLYNFRRAVCWNTLNQKMNMIFVCSDLDELNFISV